MADMDQGIKRLLQRHPADVLALAVPGTEYLGSLPTELVTEPQRVLDLLFRVRYRGVECAADIEVEARPRPEIARRLFEYGARVASNVGLPVLSIVLWLERAGAPPASPYEIRAGPEVLGTWKFFGVELYTLDAETLIAPGLVGLLPLVPFTRDGGDLAVIERTGQLMKARAPAAELGELETLLAIFGARTFGNDAMRAMLRRLAMSTEILDTSPLYQEWKQEWIAKGREEGREEGAVSTARAALLTVLRGRFGDLPEAFVHAVEIAPRDAIEGVLPYAGTETPDQLAARLNVPAE